MPVTLQVPAGTFSDKTQGEIFEKITWTLLRINEAEDNAFAIRHLVGDIIVSPEGKTYGNGKAQPVVNLTIRAPSYSLGSMEKRTQFVREITDYIMSRAEGPLERDRIYINMIHGDAFWGIGGETYTEETLLDAMAEHAK